MTEDKMKIAADTITDAQIRELMQSADADIYTNRQNRDDCSRALHSIDASVRHKARARCAEILNARAEGK